MDRQQLIERDEQLLSDFFLFQNLAQGLAQHVLEDQGCHLQVYRRDEVICDRDSFSRALGLILSGRAEVSRQSAGQSLTISTHRPGDVFGPAAMFTEAEHYVSRVTALERTRVLYISQALITDLMRLDFTAVENYLGFLTGRIHFLTRRIGSLIPAGAEQLLADYLSSHTGEDGCVYLEMSMQKLCQRLNISRASLYRALDALTGRGLIRREGKRITVLDPEGLTRI